MLLWRRLKRVSSWILDWKVWWVKKKKKCHFSFVCIIIHFLLCFLVQSWCYLGLFLCYWDNGQAGFQEFVSIPHFSTVNFFFALKKITQMIIIREFYSQILLTLMKLRFLKESYLIRWHINVVKWVMNLSFPFLSYCTRGNVKIQTKNSIFFFFCRVVNHLFHMKVLNSFIDSCLFLVLLMWCTVASQLAYLWSR